MQTAGQRHQTTCTQQAHDKHHGIEAKAAGPAQSRGQRQHRGHVHLPHGLPGPGSHISDLAGSIAHGPGRFGVDMQADAVQPVDDGLPDIHGVHSLCSPGL
jgi:hypothetical protein